MKRRGPLFVVAVLLAGYSCAPGMLEPRAPQPPPTLRAERVAAGFIVTEPPAELELPSDSRKRPIAPKVTADFKGPPTSSEFWSSLIWERAPLSPDLAELHRRNPYSNPMYAHPLTMKARAEGLELGYPVQPKINDREYMYLHEPDLVVGLDALKADATRVAGYSDWAVTGAWNSGASELRATFGHGLPYVYLMRRGHAPAKVSLARASATHKARTVNVWHQGDEWLGLSIDGAHYALFGPKGSIWNPVADAFVSDLAGKDFFSVAILPDQSEEAVELFKRHAYAFVVDTRVSWQYDARTALLRSTFDVVTQEKEPGFTNEPLLALYRHQWLNTKAEFIPKSYVSPRGEMKLLRGSRFVTEARFNGVLPILPNVAGSGDLDFFVKQVYWKRPLFPPGLGAKPQRDAYWDGKNLHRVANVLQIADQIGYTSARDHLLQALKNELEDWFDGREPRLFYYNKTWCSLIGVPQAFSSSAELNDHHFQYGYFVFAAAIVAMYDAKFAARFAPYVDLLIKDAANFERNDRRFPFLRYMDPYAGHSWANGPALFNEGNNEESSSEDVNFSFATILWGAITGNHTIRDLGIFLYTQQVAAIEQYWWDIEQQVFPKGFEHTTAAMVWGAGARYDTWWDPNPIFVHGINVLPVTGGSLYLGRHPEYVLRNYREVVERNRGRYPLTWRDLLSMYLALADAERALERLEEHPHFTPEFGNSRAMTYHWLRNLAVLGRMNPNISADTPTYAVFDKGARRTHVAFNPTPKPMTVTFSDQTRLQVPAYQLESD